YDNGTLVLEGPNGITDSYKVELTKAPTSNVVVTMSYDAKQLQLSATTLTFTPANWSTPQIVTVTAVNDTVREDQKLSLITHTVSGSSDSAYFANGKSTVSETLPVTVADDDVPGVLVLQSNGNTLVSTGAGGVTDSYQVRLTKAPTGDVTFTPINDGLTSESPAFLTFTSANWWTFQTINVTAVNITDPASPLLHPGRKQFAVQPHLLSDIKGPLEIEG